MVKFSFNEKILQTIGSAVFCGVTSFSITVVNKTVLTTFQFPSFMFLALGQLTCSLMLLLSAKALKLIEFPSLSIKTIKQVFPLPLLFIGNLWFGLGGTQSLSLPMFTAMRRISIFITLILEIKLLGVKPGWLVHASVYTIIIGSFMAAVYDVSFQLYGYIYVMICNILTSLYIVYIKKKLDSAEMGKFGLMFYDSLISVIPTIIATYAAGDFEKVLKYGSWNNPWFLACFISSCVLGFLLALSIFLCTFYNSSLTVAMIGSIKNVLLSFIGFFVGGDYVYNLLNCIGLVVSTIGSVLYTFSGLMSKTESGNKKDVLEGNHETPDDNKKGSVSTNDVIIISPAVNTENEAVLSIIN